MEHVKELISAYLDGELSAEEKSKVDKHLPACAECRGYQEELQKNAARIRSEMKNWQPPQGLADKILRRLNSSTGPAWVSILSRPWVWRGTAMAAACAVALVMVWEFRDIGHVLIKGPSSVPAVYDSVAVETATQEIRAAAQSASAEFEGQRPNLKPEWGGLPAPAQDESCGKVEPKPCDDTGELPQALRVTAAPEAAKALREWSGDNGPEEKGTFVAQNPGEWRELWKKISISPPPGIDLSRWTAVAVFAGKTPGYVLALLGSEELPGNKIMMRYRLIPPNPMMRQKPKDTRPYAIRLIPKSNSEIIFQEE